VEVGGAMWSYVKVDGARSDLVGLGRSWWGYLELGGVKWG
jgi:hypothetical protein